LLIFQDGGCRHLGFFVIVNFYLLTVSEGPRRITVPKFFKIGRSVTDILRFFEFSRWPPPQSWIFVNVKFYSLLESRVARRISVPNFFKIGQSVAKILRFFDFSRWPLPPSWIFEIVNFYLLPVSAVPRRITVPNSSKWLVPSGRYCDFSNFQDGRRRHLRLLKSPNFIGYYGPEDGILSKSVNRLRRY